MARAGIDSFIIQERLHTAAYKEDEPVIPPATQMMVKVARLELLAKSKTMKPSKGKKRPAPGGRASPASRVRNELEEIAEKVQSL